MIQFDTGEVAALDEALERTHADTELVAHFLFREQPIIWAVAFTGRHDPPTISRRLDRVGAFEQIHCQVGEAWRMLSEHARNVN